MANLSALEKRQFEDLLNMSSGYVGGYSNNTFGQLFQTVANINIHDDKYSHGSGSKANRLRAFWEIESDALVGKVLKEILAIWAYENNDTKTHKAFIACQKTVNRLLGNNSKDEITEDEFLEKDFGDISVKKLKIEEAMLPVLEERLKEAGIGLKNGACLSVIFMCGSILEGSLLGVALKNPQKFNQSPIAPKDKEGKTKQFPDWNLSQFIDVACNIGFLKLDVKKFSHVLRDFRNYIHPYMQMSSGFNPDHHTAKICMQVLKAAIAELSGER